jgi:hypothetical protein
VHQNKETSNKIATEAALLMRHGNPLNDDTFVDTIIRNVRDSIVTGIEDQAREAIREPLRQFCETAVSLAASCVSQADGRE